MSERAKCEEEYLGDGLYASFNGYSFILRAPRYDSDHWVALEPDILRAFDAYRRRVAAQQGEADAGLE
ncbi:hypothetical protein [Bradyrhizobium sp. USDA 10063]